MWELMLGRQYGAKLRKWCGLVPEAEESWVGDSKVVTGEELGGRSESGGRGAPGSVPSKRRGSERHMRGSAQRTAWFQFSFCFS